MDKKTFITRLDEASNAALALARAFTFNKIAENVIFKIKPNSLDLGDYLTDSEKENLIARKKEIFDNVIPASNSIMARNLHHLSLFFERNDYEEIGQKMLAKMSKLIQTKTRFVSNWSSLMTEFLEPTVEIVITGKESRKFASEIHKQFIPNKIICATETESKLPLFQNRLENLEKTTIFVCRDKACLLPVHSVKEALAQL